MSEVLVWILIMGSLNSGGSLLPVAQFASEKECKAAAAQILAQSSGTRWVPSGNGFCIEAKIVR